MPRDPGDIEILRPRTEPDLIELFVAPPERAGLSYMVTGGVASVVDGDPRFTRGVDLVVEMGRRRSIARHPPGHRSSRRRLSGGERPLPRLGAGPPIHVEEPALWLPPHEQLVVLSTKGPTGRPE